MSSIDLLLVALVAFLAAEEVTCKAPCNTQRPVIGIVAQSLSTSRSVTDYYPWAKGKSYISASYVKLAESSGARVVPIKDTLSDTELEALLDSINGVIFPGGDLSLSTSNYSRTATYIFSYSMKRFVDVAIFFLIIIC